MTMPQKRPPPPRPRRGATVFLAACALVVAPGAPVSGQTLGLMDALRSAGETHPALAAASARSDAADGGLARARASRWPSLAVEYGVTRFAEPMVATPIHGFDPARLPDFDRTLVQGRATLAYTVFDGGARSARIGGGEAGRARALAGERAALNDLIEAVTAAYLGVASARAVDEAAQARVAALQAEVSRAEQALEAGTAASVDVLRATTALQDALAQRAGTAATVRGAEQALARLTGRPDGEIAAARLTEPGTFSSPPPGDDASAPPDSSDPAPRVGPEGPAELDAPTHPLALQAERRIDAARAAVSAERSSRLPRVALAGGLLDFGTLDQSHVFEWQVGAQLSWTLFSGGARRAAVREARAELEVAESERRALALELRGQEDRARTDLDAARARLAALEASVTQWEELLRIERLALDAGSGTQRDLLDAEAGLFQARAGLVGAQADVARSTVRLAAAQGRLDMNWMQDFTGGTR